MGQGALLPSLGSCGRRSANASHAASSWGFSGDKSCWDLPGFTLCSWNQRLSPWGASLVSQLLNAGITWARTPSPWEQGWQPLPWPLWAVSGLTHLGQACRAQVTWYKQAEVKRGSPEGQPEVAGNASCQTALWRWRWSPASSRYWHGG